MKNSTPWDIPIESRVRYVDDALVAGKKVALMLYPKEDQSSSFRYRGYNVYQATKNSKKWQLVYFFEGEIEEVIKLLSNCHLLVFGRIGQWTTRLDNLAITAHCHGIQILYDLDDCICGPKYIKNMFNVVSPDIIDQEYWMNKCVQYDLVSQLTDGFVVTNEYLGKCLSEAHNKPFQVIKNSINEEQIAVSKNVKKEKTKDFWMGYFSGSHTHATDFEVIYPEIIQLLKTHRNFHLRIVGMLQLPKTAKNFVDNGQIEFVKMVDFLTLQEMMSDVDVNLAPLADNVFTNCKSELKFFEASLVKTPTIASPTFAFKQSIQHGITGFLCQPGEWTDCILHLYEEPEFAREIADKAYEYCMDNYTGASVLRQIEKAYDFYAKE